MSETPFNQLPLDGMCLYHMEHGAPDGRSIRHLLSLVHDAKRNILELIADTHDSEAGLPASYREVWAQALQIYDKYQRWASTQLKQENT